MASLPAVVASSRWIVGPVPWSGLEGGQQPGRWWRPPAGSSGRCPGWGWKAAGSRGGIAGPGAGFLSGHGRGHQKSALRQLRQRQSRQLRHLAGLPAVVTGTDRGQQGGPVVVSSRWIAVVGLEGGAVLSWRMKWGYLGAEKLFDSSMVNQTVL